MQHRGRSEAKGYKRSRKTRCRGGGISFLERSGGTISSAGSSYRPLVQIPFVFAALFYTPICHFADLEVRYPVFSDIEHSVLLSPVS